MLRLLLPTLSLAGCAPVDPDQARTAWLRDQLTRDNEVWLSRDPALLAAKYTKMAADRFDFVRGTAGVFLADLARPDVDRPTTTFLHEPAAAQVLLAGDPHVENVGTLRPGEEPDLGATTPPEALLLEIHDLDGAAFGPYLVDVRRGALGLATVTVSLSGCDDACRQAAIATYARAYADRVLAGDAGPVTCAEDRGAMVAALCARVAERGPEGRVLTDTTDGDGRLRLDDALDEAGAGTLALSPEEDEQLDRLLAAWDRRPADFRALDRARRYGAGVASLPAVRYVVLWDHGADGPDDDHLSSLREVVDPPAPPGRSPTVPVLFDSNAARIEEAAWRLWSRPDADVRMAGIADGAATFKVTTLSSWVDGFDHADLAEQWAAGRDDDALAGLAATLGDVLAGAHLRGVTADGEPAADAIAADLGGDTEVFVAEIVAAAEVDLPTSEADFELFQAALGRYGPLLGADTLSTDAAR